MGIVDRVIDVRRAESNQKLILEYSRTQARDALVLSKVYRLAAGNLWGPPRQPVLYTAAPNVEKLAESMNWPLPDLNAPKNSNSELSAVRASGRQL